MLIHTLYLLIFLLSSNFAEPDPWTVRKINSGYIRGRKLVTENNNEGYIFVGVPYAMPPINAQRFKRPVKSRPWIGVVNTTEYRASCYWNSTTTSNFANMFPMSEDCLHVNVYTSLDCMKRSDCPVIYYLHGGRFTFGTPTQFDHGFLVDNFASRGVIFISVSVRQAIFGILNLNHRLNLTHDVNVGFYDIVHGLKWVQDEISTFGGNPDMVTIMGHSGGGINVNLLLVSPLARGLFHQAVIMSGAMGMNVFPLVSDRNEVASKYVAHKLGCAMENTTEYWNNATAVNAVLACLRNKSALEISSQQILAEKEGAREFEGVALDSGEHALFPADYETLAKNIANVPLLTGTVSKETLDSKFLIREGVYVDQTLLPWYCEQIFITRGYNFTNETVESCAKEYNSSSRAINLGDDIQWYVTTYNLASLMAQQKQTVYLYQFEYAGIGDAYVTGPNKPQLVPDEMPAHAQEMTYILGQHKGNFTEKDKQIQKIFSGFFADFAKYGNPSPPDMEWDEFDPNLKNYFVIDFDDDMKMPGIKSGYHERAIDFWNNKIENMTGGRRVIKSEQEVEAEIKVPKEPVPDVPKSPPPISITGDGMMDTTNWQLLFWIAIGFIGFLIIVYIVTLCVCKNQRKDEYEIME